MSGETHLPTLLAGLAPELLSGEYVFISVPGRRYGDLSELSPLAVMAEKEGLSLCVPRHLAVRHGHAHQGCFRCITLSVHSSLEAVGLTAAVSATLAAAGISANVVAGARHDHVFIPADVAEHALTLLQRLGESCRAGAASG